MPDVFVAAGPGAGRIAHRCGQFWKGESGNDGGGFARVHPNGFLPASLVGVRHSRLAGELQFARYSFERLPLDDLDVNQVEVNGMGIPGEIEDLPNFGRAGV